VSSGRTSPYLAPRLGRPVVEFRCVSGPARARTYAPLPVATLAELPEEGLLSLWRRALVY
jgi:hypothetical protein